MWNRSTSWIAPYVLFLTMFRSIFYLLTVAATVHISNIKVASALHKGSSAYCLVFYYLRFAITYIYSADCTNPIHSDEIINTNVLLIDQINLREQQFWKNKNQQFLFFFFVSNSNWFVRVNKSNYWFRNLFIFCINWTFSSAF